MNVDKYYDVLDVCALLRFLLALSKNAFELRQAFLEGEDREKIAALGKSLVNFMGETSAFMKDYGMASLPEPEPRVEIREVIKDVPREVFANPFGDYGDFRVALADPKEVIRMQRKIPLIRGIRNATGLGLGAAKIVAEDAIYQKCPVLACYFGPNALEHTKLAARTIAMAAEDVKVKIQQRLNSGQWIDWVEPPSYAGDL